MFDTLICETMNEQYHFYNEHYGERYKVFALGDIDLTHIITMANGAVFIKSNQFLDIFNFSKRKLELSSKIYGIMYTCQNLYDDFIYPHDDGKNCADWACFSGCLYLSKLDCQRYSEFKSFEKLSITNPHIEIFSEKLFKPTEYKNALFLDRDGVLNIDTGYTFKVSELTLVPGIVEFLKKSKNHFFYHLVVTNQAGISKGLYTELEANDFNQELKRQFEQFGVDLTSFEICPYHVDGSVKKYSKHSFLRKPHIGMVFRHASRLAIDLSNSLMIGDRASDILNDELLSYAILNSRYIDNEKVSFHVHENFEEIEKLNFKN